MKKENFVREIDLKREDILQAIKKYKELESLNRLNPNQRIKKYFLEFEGEEYPYAYIADLVERLDVYSRKKLRKHLEEKLKFTIKEN